jgi:uncharacterized protein YacL
VWVNKFSLPSIDICFFTIYFPSYFLPTLSLSVSVAHIFLYSLSFATYVVTYNSNHFLVPFIYSSFLYILSILHWLSSIQSMLVNSIIVLSLFNNYSLSLNLSFLMNSLLHYFPFPSRKVNNLLPVFLSFFLSYFLSFFLSLDHCLPTHCKCRGYSCPWSHSITHAHTHTHTL